MQSIFAIQTKKLFAIAVSIKVLSGILAFALGLKSANALFWILTFALPLVTMAAYIYAGYHRADRSLTDEKFADSCYYMGFIFTIASIVISLFDLPSIRTNFNEIAVRFGAAMVSTLLGLIVRVYLVNFKVELNDAVTSAEDTLIRAAERFTERLRRTEDLYVQLEGQVNSSLSNINEHAKRHIEALSISHSERLQQHFYSQAEQLQDLSAKAVMTLSQSGESLKKVTVELADETRAAVNTMRVDLLEYISQLKSSLTGMQFPRELMRDKLEPAVDELGRQVKLIADHLSTIESAYTKSTKQLGAVIESASQTSDRGSKLSASLLDLSQSLSSAVGQINDTVNASQTSRAELDVIKSTVVTILTKLSEIQQRIELQYEAAKPELLLIHLKDSTDGIRELTRTLQALGQSENSNSDAPANFLKP